jgi:hypothetical protein
MKFGSEIIQLCQDEKWFLSRLRISRRTGIDGLKRDFYAC